MAFCTSCQMMMMNPMKKFKSIRQLNAEKKWLKERRAELEKAIKYDWRDLKKSLRPMNVAGQVISNLIDRGENQKGHTFISDTVSEMTARFTRKLVEKTETKIGKWFKK